MGEPISASSGPICGSRNIFQTTAATTPGIANGRMNPAAKARLRNRPIRPPYSSVTRASSVATRRPSASSIATLATVKMTVVQSDSIRGRFGRGGDVVVDAHPGHIGGAKRRIVVEAEIDQVCDRIDHERRQEDQRGKHENESDRQPEAALACRRFKRRLAHLVACQRVALRCSRRSTAQAAGASPTQPRPRASRTLLSGRTSSQEISRARYPSAGILERKPTRSASCP